MNYVEAVGCERPRTACSPVHGYCALSYDCDACLLMRCLQDTVKKLGDVPVNPDTAEPYHVVTIVDCGLNSLSKKYDLTTAQLDAVADLS